MDSDTFENLVSSLEESRFDSDKVDIIITTVQAAECVSADQIVELLEFISFHDSKLQVAKAGYRYTTDPDSYGDIVVEAFTYSDGKAKLNEYIRQNPQ
jgi:hypothetical protein